MPSRLSPSLVIAGLALFFALGGSAIAVTDALKPQARCQPGAVRGFASVTGEAAKGIGNLGDQFTSATSSFGKTFNCGGRVEARRVATGVYEVRFPGNTSQTAVTSAAAAQTTVQFVNGSFRVSLWVPGRQDAVDTPFTIVVV